MWQPETVELDPLHLRPLLECRKHVLHLAVHFGGEDDFAIETRVGKPCDTHQSGLMPGIVVAEFVLVVVYRPHSIWRQGRLPLFYPPEDRYEIPPVIG